MTCHNADMFLSLAKSLNDAILPKSQNTKLSYYIILFHLNKNYSRIPNSWTPTSDSRPHKPIQAHPSLYTYEYTFFLMAIYIYISYFVRPQFGCQISKISKILTFLQGAAKTSRLTWHNPFGYRSTQSALLGQIDLNAPNQP